MRAVSSKEDTTIGGGKYLIETGVTIIANTWTIQRDPQVWGDDVSANSLNARQGLILGNNLPQAEEFRPERMLHGSFESIPVCFTHRLLYQPHSEPSLMHGNPLGSGQGHVL